MPADDENRVRNTAELREGIQARGLNRRYPIWRQTFASLRHRNFRMFFGGQLVSLIGSWIQSTAQGWLVYELTGSKMLLGLVTAVGSTPMLLFSAWGGSIADRHPKRAIILCTQTAMMASAFVFALLVWTGYVRTWHILALAAFGGLAMAFDMPARQAFMVEITSREDLMNAISLNSSIVNGARVIGPALAGLIMAGVGIAACFFLNGLSFIAVITGLLLMRLPKFIPPERRGSALSHAAEAFSYVWSHRRMRILLVLFAIVGVFGWSYSVLMPAYAADVLKVGQTHYGILLSANGFGALFGALTVASLGHRLSRRFLVLGGLAIFSASLLLLSIATDYYLALIFLATGGWGMLLFLSTVNTVLQLDASDQMRGRVMGIWSLVFGGMMPVGGLTAGALSSSLGVRTTVAIGGTICVLAGAVVWSLVRRRPSGTLADAEQRRD